MIPIDGLPVEFARVVNCDHCSRTLDRNLLRDNDENVPQPGWIGSEYDHHRVLLVGQNPATAKSLAQQDRPYTMALRNLRDNPDRDAYQKLTFILRQFIPQWPIHGRYFPLAEIGLKLEDIAYCNLVRCRTTADKGPGKALASHCIDQHFSHWLQLLQPRVVVFIGKWAADHGESVAKAAGIPCTFMNRQRSLSSSERSENRAAVVEFVRKVIE